MRKIPQLFFGAFLVEDEHGPIRFITTFSKNISDL